MLSSILKTGENKVRLINQVGFLTKCKATGVIPHGLRSKPIGQGEDFVKNVDEFNRKNLATVINVTNEKLRNITDKVDFLWGRLNPMLPKHTMDFIIEQSKLINERNFKLQKGRLQQKFAKLQHEMNSKFNIDTENWVEDLTEGMLPNNIKKFLALGQKFAFDDRIDCLETLASLEGSICHLPFDDTESIRERLVDSLRLFREKPKGGVNLQLLTGCTDSEIKNFFKQSKDKFVVMKADKANKLVVLPKSTYNEKMMALLNDTDTYALLQKSPLIKNQNELNKMINEWKEKRFIDVGLQKKLISKNGTTPRIYGLPKTHKPNLPLRPIVAFNGAPTYNLSKYFADVLSNVIGKTDTYVKNGYEFANMIRDVKVPEGEVFVSFDVCSLYTNVPLERVEIVVEEKWNEIREHTTLPFNEFVKGLMFCLQSTFFEYQGKTFKQVFGMAMGSPISAIVANLVMEELETEVKSHTHIIPTVNKRYVDDIFIIMKKEEIEPYRFEMECFHPRLTFTTELEQDKSLAFLNVRVRRKDDGNITTEFYKKPMHSGRYLDFMSYHDIKHKRGVVRSVLDQAIKLTSCPIARERIIEENVGILMKNNYPLKFINKIKNDILHPKQAKTTENVDDERKFVSIPYKQGLPARLNPILAPHKLRIASKSNHTVRSFLPPLKDPIPMLQRSQLIYQIPCGTCNFVYIGQTKNSLEKRLKQHKYDVKKHNVANNSLANHVYSECPGHVINWEQAQIIGNESKWRARTLKESCHIQNNSRSMNLAIHKGTIPNKYQQLLKSEYKQRHEKHMQKSKSRNSIVNNNGKYKKRLTPLTYPNNVEIHLKRNGSETNNVKGVTNSKEKNNHKEIIIENVTAKDTPDNKTVTVVDTSMRNFRLAPVFPYQPPPMTFFMTQPPPNGMHMVVDRRQMQPPQQPNGSPTISCTNLFPNIQNGRMSIVPNPFNWDGYYQAAGL